MKSKTILLLRLIIAGYILILIGSPVDAVKDSPRPLVIASKNYMPFFFTEGDGIPRGILIDFWNLWSGKTGVPVHFRTMDLTGAIQQVQDGEADLIAGLSYTTERSLFFYFSRPFYEVSCHLFHRASIEGIRGLQDLAGFRVGVVAADFFEQFIRKQQPGAVIKSYPSVVRLVEGAIKGEVDAFVLENPVAMTYLAKLDGFKSIKKIASPVISIHYHAAVKKGNRNLLTTINRGLADISEEEMRTIVRAWTGGIKPFAQMQLPEKVVIASSAGSAPFHFADEKGQPVGLIIDLWQLWSQKTGIEVEFKPVSWGNTLKMVREGRADIHAGLFYNDERETYLDYATALHKSDTHFFFHKSIYGLQKLEDLIGFKIGIIQGDFAVDYIKRELPGATLALYANNAALFDAVEKGEVRVFIKDTPIALYHMSHRNILHEFKYHPQRPLYSNMFYAAVKEGNYDLIKIINKGMEAVTKEERAAIARKWMGISDTKTADMLVIALPDGFAPLFMRNFEGKPSGMLVDIWKLWAQKIGRKIEFRLSNWNETLQALRNGDADIHAGLFRSKNRRAWMDFSQPYYELPSIIFYHTRLGDLSGLEDLSGLKIGAVKGSFHDQYLRENLPDVEVVTFPGAEAMIIAAMGEQIHAFLGEALSSFTFLDRLGGRGSFKQLEESLFTKKMHAAVKKDNTALLALVDFGFNAISNQELAEIEKSWIVEPNLRQFDKLAFGVRLTTAEEVWLAEHEEIRLGVDPAWPPFEFFDATRVYSGISSDYVRLLNGKLNIDMQPVRDISWSEVLDKAGAGEIDVLPSVVKTPQRSKFLLFTKPYLSSPMVILTREDAPFITAVDDFDSGRIAVIKDYVTQEFLERDYPNREFYIANDIDEALRAVSRGKVDAFVGNLASISYTTQKLQLNNLKVATTTPYKYELAFAVRKDWPELVSILEKSLLSIPDAEKTKIHNHWTRVRVEQRVNWKFVLRLVGAIVLVGGVLVVIILRWNRALAREVNERKRAEEALREHEENLRAIYDSTTVGICVLDLKGHFIQNNATWLRMLGYTEKEHRRLTNLDVTHPEDRDETRKLMVSLVNGDIGEYRQEKRFVRKDGSIFWGEISVSPIRDKFEKTQAVIGMLVDITERKTAEEELLKLSRATEESPASVIVTNRHGIIEYVNPKFSDVTGYTAEEAIGKNPRILNAGRLPPEFYAELWQTITAGEEWSGEFCNKKKDGEIFWEYASISPIRNAEGETTHYVAVKEDITARKRMEEELIKAKLTAEDANKAKSVFLANMSHELRTPLNAILGYTELILDKIYGDVPEKIHEVLGRLEKNGRHLLGLINDVLDISKIEAGRLKLSLNDYSMQEVVQTVFTAVEPLASEKNLALKIDVSPNLTIGKGDEQRIAQVLLNLVGNAIKFTEAGEVRVEVSASDGTFLVAVSDTGPGISEADRQRIFEEFHQVDGSSTREKGGTGLGLSIVKRIIEMHGGRIWVESSPGKGSTFWFKLPIRVYE
jgi:polar amino acid transport system substrate-binding protein